MFFYEKYLFTQSEIYLRKGRIVIYSWEIFDFDPRNLFPNFQNVKNKK